MNLKATSLFAGLFAASTLAVSTVPAQAFNFTSGTDLGSCASLSDKFVGAYPVDATTLSSCSTADGFELQAAPGKLQAKKVNGVAGVGVTGGANNQEINAGESISLKLAQKSILTSLDLSFLYRPGQMNDLVFEVARVVTDTGLEGFLKVTGNTTATWSFAGGSVINLSPSNNKGGGWYSILNPFGDAAISSIQLFAPTQAGAAANSARNSDYALVGATAAAVPEPASLAGLALVGGVVMGSRRRKASKAC